MRATFPVTVHLFLFRGDRVLLSRRYNTGYEDGSYGLPAGHLEGGETVSQAAAREAKEELGIEVNAQDIRFAGVMHRKSDDERVDFFVRVDRWTGEPSNQEPEKCDDLRWTDLSSLPVNIIPYIRQALENYRQGKTFDEFGWDGLPGSG